MNVQAIVVVILCFAIFSILGFTFKRKFEIQNKIEREKLCEEAQRFFVTICNKFLTKFGSEQDAREYMTFKIYGNCLFVLHMKRSYDGKIKSKIVMHVSFEGELLVDQMHSKIYSYSSFQSRLSRVLGDYLVYDFYIKHLWGKLKK